MIDDLQTGHREVMLRSTTSVGERFVLALDLLAEVNPAVVIDADVRSVHAAVGRLRDRAREVGYVGGMT
jgi:hypothetical protein